MGCGASSDSQESSIGILDGVPVQNRELAFLEDMPTELRAPQEVPSELQATIVGGGWGKSAAQRATAKTAGAALPEWTQAPRCHVEHTGRVLIRNAAAHGVTDLEFLAGRADVALRPVRGETASLTRARRVAHPAYGLRSSLQSPDLSDAWSVHTNEPMREGCGGACRCSATSLIFCHAATPPLLALTPRRTMRSARPEGSHTVLRGHHQIDQGREHCRPHLAGASGASAQAVVGTASSVTRVRLTTAVCVCFVCCRRQLDG